MVNYKTGGLFEASVKLGAILGEATQSQRKALKIYAENIAYVKPCYKIADQKIKKAINSLKKANQNLILNFKIFLMKWSPLH